MIAQFLTASGWCKIVGGWLITFLGLTTIFFEAPIVSVIIILDGLLFIMLGRAMIQYAGQIQAWAGRLIAN